MCGRYALIVPPEALRLAFGYAENPNFPPRYNIAPTQPVPVVVARDGMRHFELMRWGFIPTWYNAPNDGPLIINARSDTVATKPAFREAVREHFAEQFAGQSGGAEVVVTADRIIIRWSDSAAAKTLAQRGVDFLRGRLKNI